MTMMTPRSRRNNNPLLIVCFLATAISIALPAIVNASPCTPGKFRVRLNDCPIQRLDPRDGDTLELEYQPVMVEFPLLYVDGDASKTPVWQHEDGVEDLDVQAKLVQGGVVRFQTKTFKTPGLDAAIPSPTIYWPKGANVKVVLQNKLDRDIDDDSYRLNMHTHGLHIGPYEDDSMVVIRPSEEHLYDYHLPRNHGGGTHWYHPHINTLSEILVGGGTAGLMIVEDADDGTEVPDFVLAMPEQVLVIQFIWPQRIIAISRGEVEGIVPPHRRTYVRDDLYTLEATDDANNVVEVPDTAFYYLVNGFVQPTVSFVKNQWTRVRMLHTSNGHDVHLHVEGAECKMYLLAKDGAYLPQGPREEFGRNEDGHQHIRLTASTRADFAIRCTGLTAGEGTIPYIIAGHHKFESEVVHTVPIMVIELLEPTEDPIDPANPVPTTNADDYSSFSFSACHPRYLPNLLADDVVINGDQPFEMVVTPFSINNDRWGGFEPPTQKNLTVMPLNTVQEWQLKFAHHPFHMHINHFMLAETVDEWDQIGDWVDTVQGLDGRITFRFLTDRYAGHVTMHCHNLDHADEGSMSMAQITNDPKDLELEREVEWAEDCNTQVPFTCNGNCNAEDWTHRPTYAPVMPSLGPTSSPSVKPSLAPSQTPTKTPTFKPTNTPTQTPSATPTKTPTNQPTTRPSATPTKAPTPTPSKSPTFSPSSTPTKLPTQSPSQTPTKTPTNVPTKQPSSSPSSFPTATPTIQLFVGGTLVIDGNPSLLTSKVKTALENALTEELQASSVSVSSRRRLADSASAPNDVTSFSVNMRRGSLNNGRSLAVPVLQEEFTVEFIALYKYKTASDYGKQLIGENSASVVEGVKQRMAIDLGLATSPLQIARMEVEGLSPTQAPTQGPSSKSITRELIGGIIGGLVLLAVAVAIILNKRSNSAASRDDGMVEKTRGSAKYEPQDSGVRFERQLVEATKYGGKSENIQNDNKGPEETSRGWGVIHEEGGAISENDDAHSFHSTSSSRTRTSQDSSQSSVDRTMAMLHGTSRAHARGSHGEIEKA